MKVSADIDGRSSLARFDVSRLRQRLVAEIERELQASALASDRPLDAEARRAALKVALQRLAGKI